MTFEQLEIEQTRMLEDIHQERKAILDLPEKVFKDFEAATNTKDIRKNQLLALKLEFERCYEEREKTRRKIQEKRP